MNKVMMSKMSIVLSIEFWNSSIEYLFDCHRCEKYYRCSLNANNGANKRQQLVELPVAVNC